VRALEELSPEALSNLHSAVHVDRVVEDPQLRDWLTANPVPTPRASVPDPLFSGTLTFVKINYNRPNQPTFSMALADIQTAVNYASLAVDPIHRYGSQFGQNSLAVSSNILSFDVTLQGDTFGDSDVQGWVDSIVRDNSLTNACVVILHDASRANSPTNSAASGSTLGYHSMTGGGHPYCFCKVSGTNLAIADQNGTFGLYAGILSHEIAEMTVDPKANVHNPEVCDACFGNCNNFQFDLFDSNRVFLGGTSRVSTASSFTFFVDSVVRPDAYDPSTECALPGSDLTAVCVYPPPVLRGELLSYGDAGTPGNVSDPMVVGLGGWLGFRFLFAGQNLSGADRIYAVDQDGQLLSYGDEATYGNVSSPVVVGFGGWLGFKFLFAGQNLSGADRIYAVVA
jgi:hypothetical protein